MEMRECSTLKVVISTERGTITQTFEKAMCPSLKWMLTEREALFVFWIGGSQIYANGIWRVITER